MPEAKEENKASGIFREIRFKRNAYLSNDGWRGSTEEVLGIREW